jgi:WD40 repeat protein
MEETAIRVWTVKDNRWTETGTLLEGHSLTVTRMSYSNDDNYVVTVGRDRKWMLFKVSWNNGEFISVDPVMSFSKAHSRIIWDVCWTPDDMFFITGSRDKSVAVWASQKNEDKFENFTKNGSAYSTVKFEEAVTSVQCAPELIDGKYFLFVGLENGDIHILSTSVENPLTWTTVFQLPHNLAHDSAVKRIQIRKTESNNSFMVASCSEDNSVRLFDVTIC